MKKILLILIILTLTGCTTKVNLEGEITEIKYNDITIQKNDYKNVKNLLNKEFKNSLNKNLKNQLTIKTKKDIYYYKISDNYVCYEGKCTENKKLGKYLDTLKNKYLDTKFYDISYDNTHEKNDDDINISLDKTSNYIIIKIKNQIKDFRINEIEYKDNTYKDIDLLYEEKLISNQTIAIRKSISYNEPDIRISFSNEYGYNISIKKLRYYKLDQRKTITGVIINECGAIKTPNALTYKIHSHILQYKKKTINEKNLKSLKGRIVVANMIDGRLAHIRKVLFDEVSN